MQSASSHSSSNTFSDTADIRGSQPSSFPQRVGNIIATIAWTTLPLTMPLLEREAVEKGVYEKGEFSRAGDVLNRY